ncbi:uncharacterized protein LOC128999497 [Macrosteles quadrilineatus]|uniref:uncharacterized protein LOC128999497 n=1 Tax=Macrosteles quadrilineatus TaxID=74068 RepID=UPI0023E199FB|nr:uncharacterized protein LOC128999497 [Macrosteles quadrilineatus]
MLFVVCVIFGVFLCIKEKAQADLSLFQSVLKSNMFIDKSLLLKEIINGEPLISITAPRKFGKSTNLDMIRKFLEIEVDEKGNPLPLASRSNHKLFKNNNLNIIQDEEFCKTNLGVYPVIYIDYGPLLHIGNMEDFVGKYTKVISETFSQHEYLLNNKTLWSNNSEISFFENLITDDVKKDQIPHSFKWLSELMRKHFGRTVFVLMDESDAVIESLIFVENNDIFEITKLLRETENNLLQSNNEVRAVLVGVIRVFRGVCDPIISHHPFLGSEKFGRFFGITQQELDDLLKNHITDEEKLTEMTNKINKYYSGYLLFSRGKTTIYNTWAIIHFLETNTHATDYLCRSEYLLNYRKICSVYGLTEWLQNLILEKEVKNTHVDIHKPYFHRTEIFLLNLCLKYHIVDPDKYATKMFLTLVYHLGYLAPLKANLQTFKIPNEALRRELKNYIPDRPIDPLADI